MGKAEDSNLIKKSTYYLVVTVSQRETIVTGLSFLKFYVRQKGSCTGIKQQVDFSKSSLPF